MKALYYGDNLTVLRNEIGRESVDLIYLDPPFNSQANYNVLFKSTSGEKSQAQIEAFDDTWHWGEEAERAFDEVVHSWNTDAAELLRALRAFLKENDMMAYLCMMAVRLLELHRVLKPTGSIYLHCDPMASHHLKLLLDAIFGAERFRNEIIWLRSTPRGHAFTRFPSSHDTLLCYAKGERCGWNANEIFRAYDLNNLDEKTAGKYTLTDSDGRAYQLTSLLNPNPNRPHLTYEFLGITKVWRWTKERMNAALAKGLIVQPKPGAVPRFKRFLDEQKGKPIGDVWTDISPINSQAQERLGYPTQKPLTLLGRIISASSNEGDTVLDPFCGCGTAIHAAQKLKRQWIGIDITHLAISLIERRLKDAFPGIKYEVHGTPKDLEGARALAAQDKYQFQWWAVSLVNAVPFGGKKKGADGGIDGLIYFKPEGKATAKAIVQVKGGDSVGVGMVSQLAYAVEQNDAKIGIFITLANSTGPMRTEAVKAGYYETLYGKYPRIQILTIADLFSGKQPNIPLVDASAFKKAARESAADQGGLPF